MQGSNDSGPAGTRTWTDVEPLRTTGWGTDVDVDAVFDTSFNTDAYLSYRFIFPEVLWDWTGTYYVRFLRLFTIDGPPELEIPLSMTHKTDANGWRKVTECPIGQYINDPFKGTTQSSTIPVEVPLVAMSGVGEYGRDLELKVTLTHNNGSEYEAHYKNWMLNHVFDHTSDRTESGAYPISNDGYAGRDVCCASCLLYTSPSPRDRQKSRMPSSA